jgi:hypothetical protein
VGEPEHRRITPALTRLEHFLLTQIPGNVNDSNRVILPSCMATAKQAGAGWPVGFFSRANVSQTRLSTKDAFPNSLFNASVKSRYLL